MKIYVGSDFHWGHANVMKFNSSTRPYENLEHMDQTMISEWNRIVYPEDKVYMLGDISFHDLNKTLQIMNVLNGTKVLVKGNHDKHLMRHAEFIDCFESIHDILEIKHNKVKIIMCHFPIAHFNGCHREKVIHLHGHLHGMESGLEQWRILDVGMDATGQLLIPIETLIEQAMLRQIRPHGSHYVTTSKN